MAHPWMQSEEAAGVTGRGKKKFRRGSITTAMIEHPSRYVLNSASYLLSTVSGALNHLGAMSMEDSHVPNPRKMITGTSKNKKKNKDDGRTGEADQNTDRTTESTQSGNNSAVDLHGPSRPVRSPPQGATRQPKSTEDVIERSSRGFASSFRVEREFSKSDDEKDDKDKKDSPTRMDRDNGGDDSELPRAYRGILSHSKGSMDQEDDRFVKEDGLVPDAAADGAFSPTNLSPRLSPRGENAINNPNKVTDPSEKNKTGSYKIRQLKLHDAIMDGIKEFKITSGKVKHPHNDMMMKVSEGDDGEQESTVITSHIPNLAGVTEGGEGAETDANK